jgi:thiopeptide-type bacteriocin biosynthesis protein
MASSDPSKRSEFVPAGFFAVRTPALSFDELLGWSQGLEASGCLTNSERLEQAIAADRAKLHARLEAIVSRPEVREALFVASPHLEESIELWRKDFQTERGQGLELAMTRYFLRMAGRATPFGLCAGCSVGKIDNTTRLSLAPRSQWKRHTRLDMDFLASLTDALAADPKLRAVFIYRPNSSLYRAAGCFRYAESHLETTEKQRLRRYQLVAVDETDVLKEVLERARDGASFADLSAALVDDEISQDEAEGYITELIENQVLVPDIRLTITGPDATDAVIDQLTLHDSTASTAAALGKVRDRFDKIDHRGVGNSPEDYRAAAKLLTDLPAELELSRFVQIDLIKPAAELSLGPRVMVELERGVKLLHRLARSPAEPDDLTRFRDEFAHRYEGRAMPLLEALDGEMGIGFPPSNSGDDRTSPLLKELAFPVTASEMVVWEKRDKFLLRKLNEALLAGEQEIVLDQREIDTIASPEPPPLPDTFALTAVLEAKSEADVASGAFRLFVKGIDGPSGATLLGRFCHADPELSEKVEKHLRAEEALRPDAIFAEIVHHPEGRIGNILARPLLRGYEIPYVGCSGATQDRQIPATDLYLRFDGQRLRLYSRRLECEVIPRLTSAHNIYFRSLPVYQFLGMLQRQGTARALWDWGALASAPFLPRLTARQLVLSRARWRLEKDELRSLGKHRGASRFAAVQRWRAKHRLPQFIALVEGDNELPLDLDNVLCTDTLLDRIKGWDDAMLVEMFPSPEGLSVHGPEGRYTHEIIVPFVRTASPIASSSRKIDLTANSARTFPPGSEWVYIKLYTGSATADRILRETVQPLVRQMLDSGASDGWFFIRYGDPDWHVRLRFHGRPKVLREIVMAAVDSVVAPLLEDGRLRRIQYDTYEREVERYGGPEAMLLAEQFFQIDSEAGLEMLEQLKPGADERWRVTLLGIDRLLNDLGFNLPVKTSVMKKLGTEFAREFRINSQSKSQLSERFRKERTALERLVSGETEGNDAFVAAFEVFRRRSNKFARIVRELSTLEKSGSLLIPLTEIAPSYVHMFVNRMLRSAQRIHETVLYDFLARLYKSQSVRHAP